MTDVDIVEQQLPKRITMAWSDDQIDMLKTMWAQGCVASEIAAALGNNISRNAVIGKAHRMGLAGRESPIKKKASARVLTLISLTERMCRWPFGDPRHKDFHFCGRPIDFSSTYCAEHRSIAYTPLRKAMTNTK